MSKQHTLNALCTL